MCLTSLADGFFEVVAFMPAGACDYILNGSVPNYEKNFKFSVGSSIRNVDEISLWKVIYVTTLELLNTAGKLPSFIDMTSLNSDIGLGTEAIDKIKAKISAYTSGDTLS
ncbi:hypothetical protein VCR5J5_1360126 [Vibrio crassostreae]|uniref:Uncharacterized protein n=2 Tax=Vibrio TaxID=662 RepID=A0A822MT48_9VIBR|nr:hypothetical protein VCR5J5_1360126 [Vibrio crassostreae]